MTVIAAYAVVVPLLLALISYPLGRLSSSWRNGLVLAAFALNLVFVLALMAAFLSSGPFSATLFTIRVPDFVLPVGLLIDFFSLSIMLALAIVLLAVAIYSVYASRPRQHSLYFSLLLLATCGLNGFVASWDLVSLYVFWEVISLSFFFLVMTDLEPKATLAGLKLFATNEVAGLALLWASLITLTEFRGTQISRVATWLAEEPSGTRGWIVLLFLFALAVRGGLVPVHTWLVAAVSHGRFAVGALLVSALNLVGLYALLRLLSQTFLASPSWAAVVGALGVASVVVGAHSALVQRDLRRILAYQGITQSGYVALGLGLGTSLGVAAATAQLLAVASLLPLLFLAFAALFRERGHVEVPTGRTDNWPIPAAASVGALAAAGLPPLIGFGPRWLLLQAGLIGTNWWLALLILVVLIGIALGVVLFARLTAVILSRESSTRDQQKVASPIPLTLTLGALACIVSLVGAPWVLFLQHAVGPITRLITAAATPELLPLGWVGPGGFALVYAGLGLGLLAYLLEAGALATPVDRYPSLRPLRSFDQLASASTATWWRWAEQGWFDLYSLLSTVVLGVGRLVSGIFLIITRRVGGW